MGLHCFSTSTKNLEQAKQVSGYGALQGMCAHTCSHAQACTKFIYLSFPFIHKLVYKWYFSHTRLCPHSHPNTRTHICIYVLYYSGWGRVLCGVRKNTQDKNTRVSTCTCTQCTHREIKKPSSRRLSHSNVKCPHVPSPQARM